MTTHTMPNIVWLLEHTWKVNMCFLIEWSQKPSIWDVGQVQYGAHGCLCCLQLSCSDQFTNIAILLLTSLLLNFSFDIVYKRSSFWPLQTLCYKIKLKCNSIFFFFLLFLNSQSQVSHSHYTAVNIAFLLPCFFFATF